MRAKNAHYLLKLKKGKTFSNNMTPKEQLIAEIERREKDLNEYWEALQKHDPTTYSYPFHQVAEIDKLKAKLKTI